MFGKARALSFMQRLSLVGACFVSCLGGARFGSLAFPCQYNGPFSVPRNQGLTSASWIPFSIIVQAGRLNTSWSSFSQYPFDGM
jgi:hypothetical protein